MHFPRLSKAALLFLIMATTFIVSCRNDELPEPQPGDCFGDLPTFTDIQPIIDRSCAYSGCHLDGNAPGVYDTYEGLLPVLSSGLFKTVVIDLRDDAVQGMPPDNAPQDRPQDLTNAEIELISCWLDAGFPE